MESSAEREVQHDRLAIAGQCLPGPVPHVGYFASQAHLLAGATPACSVPMTGSVRADPALSVREAGWDMPRTAAPNPARRRVNAMSMAVTYPEIEVGNTHSFLLNGAMKQALPLQRGIGGRWFDETGWGLRSSTRHSSRPDRGRRMYEPGSTCDSACYQRAGIK